MGLHGTEVWEEQSRGRGEKGHIVKERDRNQAEIQRVMAIRTASSRKSTRGRARGGAAYPHRQEKRKEEEERLRRVAEEQRKVMEEERKLKYYKSGEREEAPAPSTPLKITRAGFSWS